MADKNKKQEKQVKGTMTQEEEARQKRLKRRKKLKYGSVATAVTVIFVAIVVLINVIVSMLSDRFPDMVLDLTSSNVYEISDETLEYIENLDVDVEIAISTEESEFQTDTYNKMISETVDRYASYSDHITVTYFDTTSDPDILSKYQELYSGDISSNEVIVTSGERIKVYSLTDLFEIDEEAYSYYYYYGYGDFEDCLTEFKGEYVITNAIMNVTDSNPKTVGVIAYSNDDYIYSATYANYYAVTAAESLLDENGYDVVELDMINDEFDTDTYDILLLPAPASDLTEDSVEKLTDFLYNDGDLGKQLIYIADYTQGSTPNLDAFLKEWNVSVDSSIVEDESDNMQTATTVLGSYSYPIVTVTDDEDYDGGLANTSLPILAPMARPIDELTANNGRTVTELLTTSSTSYRYPLDLTENDVDEDEDTDDEDTTEEEEDEEDEETTTTTEFDEDEAERSSNAVMVLCRDQQSTGSDYIESDVLVLGSMSLLDYYLVSDSSYNNAEYFIGVLNTVCGKEDNIVIATKDLTQTSISTTDTQLTVLRAVVVFGIPAVVVVIGVVVAIRRRNR